MSNFIIVPLSLCAVSNLFSPAIMRSFCLLYFPVCSPAAATVLTLFRNESNACPINFSFLSSFGISMIAMSPITS